MTVSVTAPGDCQQHTSQGTYTVVKASKPHKVDFTSTSSGLCVEVNGVAINNYTPGSTIPGLQNGDNNDYLYDLS